MPESTITAVISSWHETVTKGFLRNQAIYSTNLVLPHPVGPFSITGILLVNAASNKSVSLCRVAIIATRPPL